MPDRLVRRAERALTPGHTVAEAGDLVERSAMHPALTSQAGHPLWRTNVTYCLIAAERYDTAEHLLSRALRHAERAGSPQWIARALWLRGLTRPAAATCAAPKRTCAPVWMVPWDHDARVTPVPVPMRGDHDAALALADEAEYAATAAQSPRAIGAGLRVRALVHGGARGVEMLHAAVAATSEIAQALFITLRTVEMHLSNC